MQKAASRPQTPVAFVRAIVQAYERRGMDPGAALRQAGLAPEELLDPEGRVAIEPFEALSSHAMRELDDEALGWFSRRLPWGSYGMLLRASLTAPTLEVALGRWCRHHGLLTEDVRIDLGLEAAAGVARIRELVDLGALREFCLVSLLRNLHGIACWLADSRIALIDARFPFSAPAHAEAYHRMFSGEIAFDAPEAELRFDAIYLQLPIVRDDASLRRMLQRPISLMARQYRQDRLMSQRINSFIAASAGHPLDAEVIAAHFNISVRSLQRHLQDEGTSVLTLTSEARRLRAEDLLRRGDLPLKRVARLAGYGDESSFGRAFRRWTGHSPAEFRRNAASPAKVLPSDRVEGQRRNRSASG
jgi:AraC-like DNA-binding protein